MIAPVTAPTPAPAIRPCPPRRAEGRSGFTLLELLVALALLVTAFSIIAGAFFAATRAWRRGGDMLEQLHQGDFAAEQVVCALRSAAWFRSVKAGYGFVLEDGENEYPADRISWVASGSALMSPESPFRRGLHRITLSIEDGPDGHQGLAARAYPHLAEDIDEDEIEPWFVSGRIRGLDCRIWDAELEDWVDEWENTNRIPCRVEISLFMDPIEPHGEPVVLRRLVDIPIAGLSTQVLSRSEVRDAVGADGTTKAGGSRSRSGADGAGAAGADGMRGGGRNGGRGGAAGGDAAAAMRGAGFGDGSGAGGRQRGGARNAGEGGGGRNAGANLNGQGGNNGRVFRNTGSGARATVNRSR